MTKVLAANPATADAYVKKAFTGVVNAWLTARVALNRPGYDYVANPFTTHRTGVFAGISPEGGIYDDNYIEGPFMTRFAHPIWRTFQSGDTVTKAVPAQWYLIEVNYNFSTTHVIYYINGIIFDTGVSTAKDNVAIVEAGARFVVPESTLIHYIDYVKVGTTRGASDIFSDDFESGGLTAWDSTSGSVSVIDDPYVDVPGKVILIDNPTGDDPEISLPLPTDQYPDVYVEVDVFIPQGVLDLNVGSGFLGNLFRGYIYNSGLNMVQQISVDYSADWEWDWLGGGPVTGLTGDVWHTIGLRHIAIPSYGSTNPQYSITIDGNVYGTFTYSSYLLKDYPLFEVHLGYVGGNGLGEPATIYFKNLKIGTAGYGSADIFSWNGGVLDAFFDYGSVGEYSLVDEPIPPASYTETATIVTKTTVNPIGTSPIEQHTTISGWGGFIDFDNGIIGEEVPTYYPFNPASPGNISTLSAIISGSAIVGDDFTVNIYT